MSKLILSLVSKGARSVLNGRNLFLLSCQCRSLFRRKSEVLESQQKVQKVAPIVKECINPPFVLSRLVILSESVCIISIVKYS